MMCGLSLNAAEHPHAHGAGFEPGTAKVVGIVIKCICGCIIVPMLPDRQSLLRYLALLVRQSKSTEIRLFCCT